MRLALALLAAIALSTPAQADVVRSCDASRPAITYSPGAATAAVKPGRTLIPCRSDTGARALEPSIAFTRDGRALFQGWELQSGSVNGLPPKPVVRRREANGTWTDVSPYDGPLTSLDPYLHVNKSTGRMFSVNFLANGISGCSTVSISDDDGANWRSSPLACGGFDGQSLTTGPPVTSSPIGFPDLVYYCTGTTPASTAPATTPICLKSLDGGSTYVPTGALPWPLADPDAQDDVFGPWAGNPAVGADGTLYLPKRFKGQPELAVSRDEGLTWTRSVVASNGAGGQTPRIALDRAGRVYYAWVGADHLPYLASSADNGTTWTAPMPLAPPGLQEAALPWPAVAPGGKRVMVAYVGTTRSPGAPYYAYCNYLLSVCEEGTYADVAWNGYLTMVDRLDTAPRLRTATVNPPSQPQFIGGCSADGACKANLDFINAQFGPDGVPAAAFSDDCALERDFSSAFGPGNGVCGDNLGMGILAELVPFTPSGRKSRRCSSRRVFLVHPHERLRSLRARVDGRRGRAKILRRPLRARIDLRGLPRKRVRVVLSGVTVDGRRYRDVRRYRTCVSHS